MISIRSALEQATLQLGEANPDSNMDAHILLCQVLNQNRAYLFAHPEKDLNHDQFETFQSYITQRSQGKPIAYITGLREFWSLSLTVNHHTLIPRHETERLVELALELIPDEPNTQILDLGTGSGAIALALAKERPNWQIDACDRCPEALLVAKGNALKHGITNVQFYQSDWFEQLPAKRYNALVSNPPYIAGHDPHLQRGDLRFEPQNALVSSQEGIADLQYLIESGYERLLPNGLILVEHGYEQKSNISSILLRSGYDAPHCWQDIHGHDRVSGGWRLK